MLARARWFRQICGTLRIQQLSARNRISLRWGRFLLGLHGWESQWFYTSASVGRCHSGWCHPHNVPFAQSQIVLHRSGGCSRHPRKGSIDAPSCISIVWTEWWRLWGDGQIDRGGARIAVPGITDCLSHAFRHSSRQVKWRFGWECLKLAMFIQRR